MASELTGNNEVKTELGDIKRKLAWRMAFAGLMIVALLGGLALFDRLNVRDNEPEAPAPQFTEPVPVAKKSITQPVTPPVAPDGSSSGTPAAPEASAAPLDRSVSVPREPPPRPEVAAQPSLPRAAAPTSPLVSPSPLAPPAPAAARPPLAGKATDNKGAPRVEPVTAQGQSPASAGAATTLLPPVAPRPLFGYALQAGVFSDPQRAEDLHARLTLAGIASTIEARVHVGPFKTRQEADAARVKLKAMGIDSVLLAPRGGKR